MAVAVGRLAASVGSVGIESGSSRLSARPAAVRPTRFDLARRNQSFQKLVAGGIDINQALAMFGLVIADEYYGLGTRIRPQYHTIGWAPTSLPTQARKWRQRAMLLPHPRLEFVETGSVLGSRRPSVARHLSDHQVLPDSETGYDRLPLQMPVYLGKQAVVDSLLPDTAACPSPPRSSARRHLWRRNQPMFPNLAAARARARAIPSDLGFRVIPASGPVTVWGR